MITGTLRRTTEGGFAVYIGGVLLDPAPSQEICNHSPDGFAWGYAGSGPAQLALAILLHFAGREFASRHYQDFKFEIVAGLNQHVGFNLRERRVKDWIEKRGGAVVVAKKQAAGA